MTSSILSRLLSLTYQCFANCFSPCEHELDIDTDFKRFQGSMQDFNCFGGQGIFVITLLTMLPCKGIAFSIIF